MGRLIDADALKDYIVIHNVGCGCSDDYQKSFLESIDDQPTIGPVRKGKWIPLQLSMANPPYQCSCCFRNAPMVETGCLVNRHLEALLTDWCPWCGAKMEEPEDIPMEYFESGGR